MTVIESTQGRSGGLPSVAVGRLRTDGRLIEVAEDLARRHAMIVGSTGAGKSRFVLGFLLEQIKKLRAETVFVGGKLSAM